MMITMIRMVILMKLVKVMEPCLGLSLGSMRQDKISYVGLLQGLALVE